MLCNDIQRVFRGEAVPRRAKIQQGIGQNLFTRAHLTVLNIKKEHK